MQKYFIIFLISLLCLSGCSNNYRGSSRQYKRANHRPSSGKGSDFGSNFSLNPFNGRSKARLRHFKKKKRAKRNRRYNHKRFSKKKRLSKKRMRSSGSRAKGRRSSGKKNKNLFDSRKK